MYDKLNADFMTDAALSFSQRKKKSKGVTRKKNTQKASLNKSDEQW